jgi:hypothetical protein
MTIQQNARVYWEMFGGVNAEGQNQYIHSVDLLMDVGGWAAADRPDDFQISVYGREYVDAPNLAVLYRKPVNRPEGDAKWKRVHVLLRNSDSRVRCIVARLELVADSFTPPSAINETFLYDDQYDTADAPPWGIRIKKCSVYGSSLDSDVRLGRVLEHILDGGGFSYSGPTSTWEPTQLSFSDIPKDRWEALDEINGMLGWNYFCWDGAEVEFRLPGTGTLHTIAAEDPRTTWSVSESVDETYNAVRVCYTNAKGKPREVIVDGDKSVLGITRADTLTAPESISSLKQAIGFGQRYLAVHGGRQVTGNLSIAGFREGKDTVDPLTIRPGDMIQMGGAARYLTGLHEVTRVTLRPLDWAAEVQFGANSKRFDTWLARLAVGAKKIQRR